MFREYSPPLNPMNRIIHDGLRKATAALQQLGEQGATVIGVRVWGGRPIIEIDAPTGLALESGLKVRHLERGIERVVRVATIEGCQVEWEERRSARQAEGVHAPG